MLINIKNRYLLLPFICLMISCEKKDPKPQVSCGDFSVSVTGINIVYNVSLGKNDTLVSILTTTGWNYTKLGYYITSTLVNNNQHLYEDSIYNGSNAISGNTLKLPTGILKPGNSYKLYAFAETANPCKLRDDKSPYLYNFELNDPYQITLQTPTVTLSVTGFIELMVSGLANMSNAKSYGFLIKKDDGTNLSNPTLASYDFKIEYTALTAKTNFSGVLDDYELGTKYSMVSYVRDSKGNTFFSSKSQFSTNSIVSYDYASAYPISFDKVLIVKNDSIFSVNGIFYKLKYEKPFNSFQDIENYFQNMKLGFKQKYANYNSGTVYASDYDFCGNPLIPIDSIFITDTINYSIYKNVGTPISVFGTISGSIRGKSYNLFQFPASSSFNYSFLNIRTDVYDVNQYKCPDFIYGNTYRYNYWISIFDYPLKISSSFPWGRSYYNFNVTTTLPGDFYPYGSFSYDHIDKKIYLRYFSQSPKGWLYIFDCKNNVFINSDNISSELNKVVLSFNDNVTYNMAYNGIYASKLYYYFNPYLKSNVFPDLLYLFDQNNIFMNYMIINQATFIPTDKTIVIRSLKP